MKWGMVTGIVYRDLPGPRSPHPATTRTLRLLHLLAVTSRTGNGTVNVHLIEPGTMYGERQRQLDLRISKRLRFGGMRLTGNLDVSNILNGSAVTAQNNTFGPNWQVPSAIQFGRFVKLGGQLDF